MAEKVILITGASSGIGAALARQLAARGDKVALAARRREQLEAVGAKDALVIPTDVTKREQCHAMVEQTIKQFGRLDVLVNNAGMSMYSRFEDVQDFTIFERLIQINYLGAVYCTEAALPHLKQSSGLIVAVSSISGITGVPFRTGYSASKHAMQGFFDSLRVELMDSGVDVSMVSPDFVDTDIRQKSFGADGQPLGNNPMHGKKIMSADEAARQMIDVIDNRRRELIMGRRGKLVRLGKVLAPGLVDRITRRSIEK
jgi:short-subunit dehydrogenase